MSNLTIGYAPHFTKGQAIVEPVSLSWDKFQDRLQDPSIGKKSGKHFTCVTFKENHRLEVNALSGSVFVLDGDSSMDDTIKGAPHPQLVHDVLADLDITHCIYSSHSNVTKGHRYRVVMPCVWNGKWELEALVTWTIDKLHHDGVMLKNANENLKMSNPWYLPSVPDEEKKAQFVFLQHDGLQPFPIDEAIKWWGSEPKTTARYVKPNGNGTLAAGKYDEGGRNNMLYTIGCSMRARGLEFADILTELVIVNDTKMNPRLEDGDVLKTARSAASQPKGEQDASTGQSNGNSNQQVKQTEQGFLSKIVDQTNCNKLFPDCNVKVGKEEVTYSPLSTTLNWQRLIGRYQIDLKFNEMTRIIEVHDGGQYGLAIDDPEVSFPLLKDGGLRNGLLKTGADELLNTIAYRSPYHPLKEYLAGVKWDGIDRTEQIISAVKTTDVGHFRMVLIPWLVSTVAAVYGYGDTPPRGVLVFTGAQNIGKTGTFKRISPIGMFKEGVHLSIGGANETDSVVNATNSLVVELGEIDTTFKKSEISALKSFIGKSDDEYRVAYGRFTRKYPRKTVYCGSVNDSEFLQDATGNSRFWVVSVKSIDFDAINSIDNLQLWAQIKHLYDAGAPWLLTNGEMDLLNIKNEEHREKSQVEIGIDEYFQWDDPEYLECRENGFECVTKRSHPRLNFLNSAAIAEAIGFADQVKNNRAVAGNLTRTLRRVTGMEKQKQIRPNPEANPVRVWVIPPIIG